MSRMTLKIRRAVKRGQRFAVDILWHFFILGWASTLLVMLCLKFVIGEQDASIGTKIGSVIFNVEVQRIAMIMGVNVAIIVGAAYIYWGSLKRFWIRFDRHGNPINKEAPKQ
jgi:hypothetical protein